MGEGRRADVGAGPVHEIDDAGRQAGLLEQLHRVVRGQRGRRGGLPDDGAPHQRWRAREVGADGREVERADREHETLERPVLEPVPDAGRGHGLLFVDARQVARVEPEEVDRLAGSVDLGLVRRLRLSEHRCRVEGVAPRPCQELRRAKQDRYPLFPGGAAPVLPGVGGRVDRLLDLGRAALMDVREHMLLVVGYGRGPQPAGQHLPAPDHARNLDPLLLHLLQALLQALSFGRPGSERVDRLVGRWRRAEDPGCAHGAMVLSPGGWESGPSATRRPGGGSARYGSTASASSGTTRHALDRSRNRVGLHPLAERFVAYFAGEQVTFEDVQIELEEYSDFHRDLVAALRRVPRGQVVSYGELAALAGRPGAHRAAGSFCARNRIAIVVPCHRVVAAEGLGSYGELGVDYKRRLLELEGWSERDVAV